MHSMWISLIHFTSLISIILTHLFHRSESKVKLWNLIFWRSSIPKDLLGGKVGEKYFYSHRGAPFWENWLQSWKIAILTPCLKIFPKTISLWSVTKRNSEMFPNVPNFQWLSGLRFLRGSKGGQGGYNFVSYL